MAAEAETLREKLAADAVAYSAERTMRLRHEEEIRKLQASARGGETRRA